MKQILILLIAFSIYVNCFSQHSDSISKPDLIYLNGFGWKKGDKKLKPSTLRMEIFKTTDAIPYFKKGKTKTFLSYVFFIGGSALVFVAVNSCDYNFYNSNKNSQRNALASAALASLIAGGIMLHFSLKDIGKAVHLRNLDILKQ